MAGIAFKIAAGGFPYSYTLGDKQFDSFWFYYKIYVVVGLLAIVKLKFSNDLYIPKWRVLSLLAFFVYGFGIFTPLFVIATTDAQLPNCNLINQIYSVIAYTIGSYLYANRVPEKCTPGTFDYCGTSHNFLHFCVIFGAFSSFISSYDCYRYSLAYT